MALISRRLIDYPSDFIYHRYTSRYHVNTFGNTKIEFPSYCSRSVVCIFHHTQGWNSSLPSRWRICYKCAINSRLWLIGNLELILFGCGQQRQPPIMDNFEGKHDVWQVNFNCIYAPLKEIFAVSWVHFPGKRTDFGYSFGSHNWLRIMHWMNVTVHHSGIFWPVNLKSTHRMCTLKSN